MVDPRSLGEVLAQLGVLKSGMSGCNARNSQQIRYMSAPKARSSADSCLGAVFTCAWPPWPRSRQEYVANRRGRSRTPGPPPMVSSRHR
eukprot:4174724-Pyramimonas_sp.AAC.1